MKPLIGTATLLAGHAVALAEGFIGGRTHPAIVADKVPFLYADLRRLRQSQDVDFPTSSIIDAAFLLAITLTNASRVRDGDAIAPGRADRWRELIPAMIEHVRRESLKLNEEGHIA